MLLRFATRALTGLSPRLAFKAAYLYGYKGARALSAYKRRLKKGEWYPPFMCIALTNACNLRCNGCWVQKEGALHHMSMEEVCRIIDTGREHKAFYYTLLGGEPFMYEHLWEIFEKYPDCYFQVITNGMFFDEANVAKLVKAGNVTPLISIDGFAEQNDLRRGKGVFESAEKGMALLKKAKLLFGIATTVTGKNVREVMSDDYVRHFIDRGAMYLWYYVFRPVGETSLPELCVSKEQLIWMRKELLRLRRTHPIMLVDTYWTANGEATCPAAIGLSHHIGPRGSIELCPALSFAAERVSDNGKDLFKTVNESKMLRGFPGFVEKRTKGCVILEYPQDLHDYLKETGAKDYSGRDTAFEELNRIEPRTSHHLPGDEIPEDYWVYRFMKKRVFFGMGGYG